MDDRTLYSINIACRNASDEALEFLGEFCDAFVRGYPADEQGHARERFWVNAYEALEKRTRESRVTNVATGEWLKPMGREEATKFEKTVLEFGRYSGRKIGEIYAENAQYLEWFADADYRLKKDLKRYLIRKENDDGSA